MVVCKIDCFAPKPPVSPPGEPGDLEDGAGEDVYSPPKRARSEEPSSPRADEPYLEPRDTDAAAAGSRSMVAYARSGVDLSLFLTLAFWKFSAALAFQCWLVLSRLLRIVHALALKPAARALLAAPPPPPPDRIDAWPHRRPSPPPSPVARSGRDPDWVRRRDPPGNGDVEAVD